MDLLSPISDDGRFQTNITESTPHALPLSKSEHGDTNGNSKRSHIGIVMRVE